VQIYRRKTAESEAKLLAENITTSAFGKNLKMNSLTLVVYK